MSSRFREQSVVECVRAQSCGSVFDAIPVGGESGVGRQQSTFESHADFGAEEDVDSGKVVTAEVW